MTDVLHDWRLLIGVGALIGLIVCGWAEHWAHTRQREWWR